MFSKNEPLIWHTPRPVLSRLVLFSYNKSVNERTLWAYSVEAVFMRLQQMILRTINKWLTFGWIFYFSTLKNCIALVWKSKKWNRSTGVSCKSNRYRNNAGLWPKNAAEWICRQLVNLRVAFLDLKICAVLLDIQHRSENHLFIGTYI